MGKIQDITITSRDLVALERRETVRTAAEGGMEVLLTRELLPDDQVEAGVVQVAVEDGMVEDLHAVGRTGLAANYVPYVFNIELARH